MKILFFRVAGIGDVILTTPLIRQVKEQFPSARIDYLVGKSGARVLKNNPYLDNIIKIRENIIFKKKVFAILKLILKIRKEKYDAVFVLGKHWFYGFLSYFFKIKKRIGFKRENDLFLNYSRDYKKARHEIYYYLDLAKGLNFKPDYKDIVLDVFLKENQKEFAKNYFKKNNLNPKNTIVIAAGGGINKGGVETIKRWPQKYWLKLIKLLKKANKSIILIGDKNDKDVENYILKKESVLSLIGKTSLLKTAAIIEKSRAIISSDSGLVHLGSALNQRVLSIFGPTDPKRFAPLNKKSQYLFAHIDCSPCYDMYGNFKTVCNNKKTCLYSISPQMVFKKLKNII